MIDWTDLRYFAAVSRSGSLAGAARALGVNHSTVFRRINSLEGTLAVKLFERTRTGYVLTPEGEEMMATALGVEDAIATLDRRLTGKDYRLSGSVRVTAPDTIGAGFLEGLEGLRTVLFKKPVDPDRLRCVIREAVEQS